MSYKITLFGAGNIGAILAGKFSQCNDVCVYLNDHERKYVFQKDLKVISDNDIEYKAKIDLVTSDIKEAIEFAEIIFITYPASLFEEYSRKIIPLLKKNQHLVFAPGSGGAELFFKDAIKKGATISGLQRVHSVGRYLERGVTVKESGIRKELYVASIPGSFNDEMAMILENLYGLKINKLDNYLDVTLVNSNPLLHTSRLYTLFKNYKNGVDGYDKLPLFYEEWNLESSDLLIDMDFELTKLFDALKEHNLPVTQIKSLLEHYESTDRYSITKKLNSINSLKGLKTPSKLNDKMLLEPDFSSRYFTSDFPYGLDILISFCTLFDIDCPKMRAVSSWYHKIVGNDNKFDIICYVKNKKELLDFYGK